MPIDPPWLDQEALYKAMTAAASSYNSQSIFQQEVAKRLLGRLELMRLQPAVVLDFGARTGVITQALRNYYPEACVYGCDLSQPMLSQAVSHGWLVASNYLKFPFQDHSVDLIFSNLTLHWSADIKQTLAECQRVLKPDGLLLFSTLGPDTLHELSSSFDDSKPHVHHFVDMHDIGDVLQNLSFSGPVMEMERLSLHYDSVELLLKDIKLTGCHNTLAQRSRGLMGQDEWQRMLFNYNKMRSGKGPIPATFEIIYGHAFGVDNHDIQHSGEVTIPLDRVRRNL